MPRIFAKNERRIGYGSNKDKWALVKGYNKGVGISYIGWGQTGHWLQGIVEKLWTEDEISSNHGQGNPFLWPFSRGVYGGGIDRSLLFSFLIILQI